MSNVFVCIHHILRGKDILSGFTSWCLNMPPDIIHRLNGRGGNQQNRTSYEFEFWGEMWHGLSGEDITKHINCWCMLMFGVGGFEK